ncbi:beta-hexosaminidase subunit alpha-like isoform X1 [Haliotis cracherodii]|uniref:beta-hexosaminidase subunit alpha-like isoform X1 n=1 Tax=Haliotis cracherodii TaxID=6455 RepID=UPI0039EC365F
MAARLAWLCFLVVLVLPANAFEEPKSRAPVAATVGAPWPLPQNIKQSSTVFTVDAQNFIFVTSGAACDILDAAYTRYISLTFGQAYANKNLRFRPRPAVGDGVLSSLSVTVSKPCQGVYPSLQSDESYDLQITPDGASLKANEVWGALRGLETFSQLVTQQSSGEFVVMESMITDAPRFKHRGMLLDTSRHYLSVGAILKNLEAMSQNKFNVFHWHIVDDQAFPFESTAFPDMSKEGAYNPETHVYTQASIKEIIEFARLRGIRVMPEFDSPGHSQSWGKAITNLLTPCYSHGKPDGSFGPINPIPESTYTFLKTFFQDVGTTFPDHYIHMGGDEVSFTCWMSNPNITSFVQKMNYTSYGQVEQYYMQKLLNIINGLGKGYQVWQEVIDNGAKVQADTVVEVWKDPWPAEMAKVTKMGYNTLLSTCWYLNYISYGSDWTKYYACDPFNFDGSPEQKALVIGGETAMWGEYVDDTNLLSRLWPRASSVGERLWSAQSVNSTSAAEPRLIEHRCRMVRRGIPAEPISGPGFCDFEYRT